MRILFLVTFLFGMISAAEAQDITTIPNTTNTCILSTYKFWSPNMTSPTVILIDKRMPFNPVPVCTAGVNAGNATTSCGRDPGPVYFLSAQAFGTAISNNPFCSWDCGACGTIVTDGSDGLPVELLELQIE